MFHKRQRGSSRKLVWTEEQNREAPGCSECAWVFHPSSPSIGETMDEMRRNYHAQRSEEFASHDCAEHPRGTGANALSQSLP